jgi:hypothetical protein
VPATPDFTAEERNLLVRLPRWIVDAVRAVGGRGRQEAETGFLSVANGRKIGNPLVAQFAEDALKVYDQDPRKSGVDTSKPEGVELVLGYAQRAMLILREKAGEADASAYRRWLVTIADDAMTTIRTLGGLQIHPEQRQFRERLADATRSTPPAAEAGSTPA